MTPTHGRDSTVPRRFRPILLAAALMLVPTLAIAEYRLQPGDVVDVLVAGIPDFRAHVAIGLEGNIGLPLAGRVSVGGMSLTQAQERISAELANKLYRQYTADGREISHLILSTEVVVEVSEDSPIYVSGDVSKPGVYPFRPGLTVRQAIAVAGGLAPSRGLAADPVMQAADLEAQYATLRVQYQAETALVSRLRKELSPGDVADDDRQSRAAADGADPFVSGEAESLAARKAGLESNRASLQAAVKQASVQLALLQEKRGQDEEGSKADVADYNSVRDLFRKGLAASARLSDARRAAMLSSEQLLQTLAQMNDVERQRSDYARQLQNVDTQARIDGLDRLQQAVRRAAELRSTMKGVNDRLALLGRPHTDRTVEARLSVFRKDVDGSTRIAASDDLTLVPGDVVEAAVAQDPAGGTLASAAPLH